MRSQELLTLGLAGKLLERLREYCHDHGVWLRELGEPPAALALAKRGSVGALVLRVGRDVEAEYRLLAELAREHPRLRVVLLSDVRQTQLAALGWHLGATAVLFPPLGAPELFDLLPRLLP